MSFYSKVLTTGESLSSSECTNLGYSSMNLMCSNCNDLKQFKLAELEHSCRKCCANDENDQVEGEAKMVRQFYLDKWEKIHYRSP